MYKNVISFGNTKLKYQAQKYRYRVGTTFDILAGYTCPMALQWSEYLLKGE